MCISLGLNRADVASVFTLSGLPTSSAISFTATTVGLVPTASLTQSATLIPFPSSTYQFPTGAVIAASVSVSLFLSVLVIAVAFIVWYRLKVRAGITRREGSVDQPTATDNLMDGLEPSTLNAQTRTSLEPGQSEGSESSEDNGPGPGAREV
jgi:hypothetical protein